MANAPRGLVYYPDNRPGISRERWGRGFSYRAPDGTRIDRGAERNRIEALAVPPAYENVWICPADNGHLQATGRDARLRKQYRYHPTWTEYRAEQKYADLAEFGRRLPSIRRKVSRELSLDAGEHAFALAAVIAMIDHLSIRIGTPDYAAENGTFGATTLTSRHLKLEEGDLFLAYKAKGGRKMRRTVSNRKLLRSLQALDDLPGAELVSWVDDDGAARSVRSEEVNEWLHDVTGSERMTAKTFRTWNGSVAALTAARSADRVTIKAMAEAAAERLGNTASIARKSYIHPAVIGLADGSTTMPEKAPDIRELRRDERFLIELLETES
ncbi:MAG: DNA topoisomerase IB [Silicimonas sp.]|nr:DNA topoisomerase IB [Silicimonas sp.]